MPGPVETQPTQLRRRVSPKPRPLFVAGIVLTAHDMMNILAALRHCRTEPPSRAGRGGFVMSRTIT